MTRTLSSLVLVPVLAMGCGGEAEPRNLAGQPVEIAMSSPDLACEVVGTPEDLPEQVPESSGLARSSRNESVFWTHNDAGNDPELFGVSEAGTLVQRIQVGGAELADWEDIEAAPCGNESCLYVGDIGDNDGDRDRITVYRLVEPTQGMAVSQVAETLHARYPDGPRDAEALFVDGAGTLYVVTKGRREAITLYRWPAAEPGQTVTLERVRDLFPEPEDDEARVTAASATPDGRWIGIRTYRTLYVYPSEELLGAGQARPQTVDLGRLGEAKGEALALADDGRVWLSSEAEGGGPARLSQLKCTFPAQ